MKHGNTECFNESGKMAEGTPGKCGRDPSRDRGNAPTVFDMSADTRMNTDTNRVVWTGKHMQLALRKFGSEASYEPIYNENGDAAIYVIRGDGEVRLGKRRSAMGAPVRIGAGSEIVVPEDSYYMIQSDRGSVIDAIVHYSPKAYPFGFSEK